MVSKKTNLSILSFFFFSFFILSPLGILHAQTTGTSGSIVTLSVVSSPIYPRIVLNGSSLFELTVGTPFVDPGATATDSEMEDLTNSIVVTGGVNNGPTVNTNVIGTTVLLYSVTDPHNDLTSSVTRTVVVNPVPVPNTGEAFFPGQYVLSISDFNADIGTSSVVMNWISSVPITSVLSWGTDPDGSAGTISEVSPTFEHGVNLNNLEPDTTYYIVVHMYSASVLSNYFLYSFTTLPITGYVLPTNVTDVSVHESSEGDVLIDWVNPSSASNPDIAGVRITRGTRYFPRDPNEGYIAYEGDGDQYLDQNVTADSDYYYSIFTKDTAGNYSSGVAIHYIPASMSTASSTGNALLGGTVTEMASTTFSDIIFLQDNKLLPSNNGIVTVENGTSLIIKIPPDIIPRYNEETLIDIGGTIFICRQLDNGWLEASIPSTFKYQNPLFFSIRFLGIGTEVLLDGTFIVSTPSSQSNQNNLNASGTASFAEEAYSGHFNFLFLWLFWIILAFVILTVSRVF